MNRQESLRVDNPSSGGKWRQYYTCFTLSLLCMTKGLASAWSSPMILILQSDESPVGKMTDSQINTLQTVTTAAGVAGIALIVITLIKFGTKVSTYVQALVTIAGSIVLIFAMNPILLNIGRFLTGTTAIGVEVVSSFYLSEIAHDCRRGALIALAIMAGSGGSLLGYGLGTFCGYKLFNALCLVPAAVFPLFFFVIPESPAHLTRHGRIEEAQKSFVWFRGVNQETAKAHVEQIALAMKGRKISPKIVFETDSNRRALVIATFLNTLMQLCGVSVISQYTAKMFQIADGSMSPNNGAFMLAGVSFGMSLIGAFLIERVGRKILFMSMVALMALSLYVITAFYIIQYSAGHDTANTYQLLIYLGMAGYSGSSAVASGSVTQTLIAEMVPAGVKGMVWMFAGVASLVTSLLTLQIYNQITEHLPYFVNFLLEGIVATAGVLVSWVLILETRGKSLAHITAELRGENYNPDDAYIPVGPPENEQITRNHT